MATKIRKPRAEAKPAAPDIGTDDLSILHPDLTLTIAGRTITLREYRFDDTLRIRLEAKAMIADLQDAMTPANGEELHMPLISEDVLDVLAKHRETLRKLIAESIGDSDTAWVDSLSGEDGETLLMGWYGVCGPFFVRAVARRIGQALVVRDALARRTGSAGPTSLNGSRRPGMGGSTSSAAGTPSVN